MHKRFIQQFQQGLDPARFHVRKLGLMQLSNRLVQFLERGQSLRGNPCFNYPSIVFLSLTSNEPALFHAVEQSRHVWIVRDHALTDAAAEQAFGLCATQNAQYVVLRPGQIVGFYELLCVQGKGIGDFDDGDEEPLLGEGFGATWFASRFHVPMIVVTTTIVNT